jgi:hypothetical protein
MLELEHKDVSVSKCCLKLLWYFVVFITIYNKSLALIMLPRLVHMK